MITLPLPPTANFYWRVWRGRPVLSNEARAYKLTAAKSALAQGLRVSLGPLKIRLRLYRKQRRGDLDNRLKVLLDALEGVAYQNDSQVMDLHAKLFDDPANPRVELELEAA